MELARRWFTSREPLVPDEIEQLLSLKGIILREGWPEHVTLLPERGEGRNHDLLLLGEASGFPAVVTIEAKVDESFGPRIGEYCERKRRDEKSKLPRRARTLLAQVFGEGARPDEEPWSKLRYQLLTAVAATAIEAQMRAAALGLFIVHELHTCEADEARLARNARALTRFVKAAGVPAEDEPLAPGKLYGPIHVRPSTATSSVDVWVGRAVFNWGKRLSAAI
jgi:hypothetical protein